MDLLDWKADLPESSQIYAVIDPLADNEPLKYWYQHADSTDAWPLYAGTEYGDDVLSGPWLLPLAQLPSWSSWWQEQEENEQATGFLLASEVPPERLAQHWISLIKAGLDGEEVLFRFYDPRVLGPMLFTFTEDETRRFLGPTDEILVWHQGEWVTASPYPEPEMTEHIEPWWRMQPQHLSTIPGQKERLIENLDHWLWQQEPDLMSEWLQTHDDVRQQLSFHYDEILSRSSVCPPALLFSHLFGYRIEWDQLQLAILAKQDDEQTELLAKTMQLIKQKQQKEMWESHGE